MENQQNLYKTADIKLAACLIALGQNFLDALGDPWRLDFVFTNSEEIPQIEADLLAGQIRVEPLALLQSYSYLKGMV